MPDDGANEEPVIRDGLTCGDLCRAQIEMHPVVVARNGFDIKVGETVDLQLKGHGWLKMAVDGVLLKLYR